MFFVCLKLLQNCLKKTSNSSVSCLQIPKVFTTGTNRWDWHRTEHQQPTLEDGNLRWGENGIFSKDPLLEDADSSQRLPCYKQTIGILGINQGSWAFTWFLWMMLGDLLAILGWWFSWFFRAWWLDMWTLWCTTAKWRGSYQKKVDM